MEGKLRSASHLNLLTLDLHRIGMLVVSYLIILKEPRVRYQLLNKTP
jgi:hypothetical protein